MGNRELSYTISGSSMNPLLRDGDQVKVMPSKNYEVGDIVVATHPIQTDLTIIKEITEVSEDGRFRLRGLNTKESTDKLGLVEKAKIVGKVMGKA